MCVNSETRQKKRVNNKQTNKKTEEILRNKNEFAVILPPLPVWVVYLVSVGLAVFQEDSPEKTSWLSS